MTSAGVPSPDSPEASSSGPREQELARALLAAQARSARVCEQSYEARTTAQELRFATATARALRAVCRDRPRLVPAQGAPRD